MVSVGVIINSNTWLISELISLIVFLVKVELHLFFFCPLISHWAFQERWFMSQCILAVLEITLFLSHWANLLPEFRPQVLCNLSWAMTNLKLRSMNLDRLRWCHSRYRSDKTWWRFTRSISRSPSPASSSESLCLQGGLQHSLSGKQGTTPLPGQRLKEYFIAPYRINVFWLLDIQFRFRLRTVD